MGKLKVGELAAVLSLEDRLTKDMAKAGRNFEKAGEGLYATGTLDADWSKLDAATKQAEGRLSDVDAEVATAKIDADNSGAMSAGAETQKMLDGLVGADLAGIGGAGAAAGALFALNFQDAIQQEAQADFTGQQLGLTNAEAQELGGMAGSLYRRGFGDSLEQIGQAQAAAIQSNLMDPFTQSDAEIQGFTSQLLTVSDLLGEDVGRTAQTAGQMVRTGLAKNGTEALDMLTKGLQIGDNRAGDLLDTMAEYAPLFQSLGLDGQTSMGMLTQAMSEGAWNTDHAGDALKEFSIRAKDGSKLTADSFAALGLDSRQMADDIAAGGPRAAAALDTTLARLRAMEDPVQRNQVAVGLFGTKAEDLQAALYSMDPTAAVAALGEVSGAAQTASDEVSDNFQSSWEITWRKLTTDFGGAMSEIGEGLGGTVDTVEEAFGEIPGWLGGLWEQIEDLIGRIPEALGAIFEGLEGLFLEPLKSAWNSAAGWFNGLTFPTMGPWDVDAGFLGSYTIGPWGGWDLPDLPTFHGGGTFRTSMPGGEGLAMLKDGETVQRPGGGAGAMPPVVNITVQGNVMTEGDLMRKIEAHLLRTWKSRGGL